HLSLLVGAFFAGVGMFLAPCTLPIVPGYLGFIGGGASASRASIMRNAVAYVLGFSVVFILLGLFAVSIGHLLGIWRLYLPQVAGALIVLFGLTMLGLRIPGLSGERHIKLPRFLTVGRVESSFFIGAIFALGWSPCIGPILGTVLLMASQTATAGQGAVLLAVFSLGLGVPFLLAAFLLNKIDPLFARLGHVSVWMSKVSAVLLIAIGVLMLTNTMGFLVTYAFELLAPLHYDALLKYL
ncbi:MAG TPA: cytochrome c biogenesis protein CcdA, partial [Candidatus Paceibacterota bacterium]